jgi:hypothetical protein
MVMNHTGCLHIRVLFGAFSESLKKQDKVAMWQEIYEVGKSCGVLNEVHLCLLEFHLYSPQLEAISEILKSLELLLVCCEARLLRLETLFLSQL